MPFKALEVCPSQAVEGFVFAVELRVSKVETQSGFRRLVERQTAVELGQPAVPGGELGQELGPDVLLHGLILEDPQHQDWDAGHSFVQRNRGTFFQFCDSRTRVTRTGALLLEQAGDLLPEDRQLVLDHVPYDRLVDAEVLVDQDVAEPRDPAPVDLSRSYSPGTWTT
jgi:hypothetical protein